MKDILEEAGVKSVSILVCETFWCCCRQMFIFLDSFF